MYPGLWAIIPVKPFSSGKSRLAGVLDAGRRQTLNRRMFEHVLGLAMAAIEPIRVIVATPDTTIATDAQRRGGYGVIETEESGLNAALRQGCRYAMDRGAQAIMVLPSDLPFLTAEDIAALASALPAAPGMAIAPDASETATNALALSPPQSEFFRFGPSSFEAHMEAAREHGYAVKIVRRPGLAFDLDTPENYRAFMQRSAAT